MPLSNALAQRGTAINEPSTISCISESCTSASIVLLEDAVPISVTSCQSNLADLQVIEKDLQVEHFSESVSHYFHSLNLFVRISAI